MHYWYHDDQDHDNNMQWPKQTPPNQWKTFSCYQSVEQKINNNNYEVMHVYISFVDEDNQMSSVNF